MRQRRCGRNRKIISITSTLYSGFSSDHKILTQSTMKLSSGLLTARSVQGQVCYITDVCLSFPSWTFVFHSPLTVLLSRWHSCLHFADEETGVEKL